MHSCGMQRCIHAGCCSALMLHAGQRLLPYHPALQYGAVWCSVLQRVVVRCSVLQCDAVCRSVLQCVAGAPELPANCESRQVCHDKCVKISVSRHVFHDKCFKACVSRRVFQGVCFKACIQSFSHWQQLLLS